MILLNMDPVLSPKHKTSDTSGDALKISGSIISTCRVSKQPSESVTTKEYVSGARDVISCVNSKFDHSKLYGGSPPLTETEIEPSFEPKHETFVTISFIEIGFGVLTENVSSKTHELSSIISIV